MNYLENHILFKTHFAVKKIHWIVFLSLIVNMMTVFAVIALVMNS